MLGSAKRVFLLSSIFFILSFFNKERPPQKDEILPQLFQEPLQTETQKAPFKVTAKKSIYKITPLYNYELYGLVASYHFSSSFADYYHDEWGDFLNPVDIALVYGDNIKSEVYRDMTFNSDSWWVQPDVRRDKRKDWKRIMSVFKGAYFSNNHLLSGDPEIVKGMKSVHRWDQIYFKGYLVSYGLDGRDSGCRTSSTVRTDHGCESVYVTDFKILKKANVFWHLVYALSRWSVICSAIAFFYLCYRRSKEARHLDVEEDASWRHIDKPPYRP